MVNKDMNQLVGSLTNLLNTDPTLVRPYTPYIGSFFFGPNQELTFRNRVPKGRVTPGETFIEDKGFGKTWRHTKFYNIHIDFFTLEGFTDTSGNKNISLLNRYNQLIEDSIRSAPGSYGNFTITDMTNEVPPQRAEDIGNNVWITRSLFVFKERHC